MKVYKRLFEEKWDELKIVNKLSKGIQKYVKHNKSVPTSEAIGQYLKIYHKIDTSNLDLDYIKTSIF